MTRPRWATHLPETAWVRVGELIDDGYYAAEIMRQVPSIPQSKRRSLVDYVRRYGPRRRLTKFAEFKDALLGHIDEFAGNYTRALTLLAERAVDPTVKASEQRRAVNTMTLYTALLTKLVDQDREDEVAIKREDAGRGERLDPNEMVQRILDAYGVQNVETSKHRNIETGSEVTG